MTRRLDVLLVLALCLLGIACAGNSGPSGGGSSTATSPAVDSAHNLEMGSAKLQGEWTTTCFSFPDIKAAYRLDLTFTGDTVDSSIKSYADMACAKVKGTETFHGVYQLGTVGGRAGSNVTSVDFMISRETINYADAADVALLNADPSFSPCTAEKLKAGVTQEVVKGRCMQQEWLGQSPFRSLKFDGSTLIVAGGHNSGESAQYRMTDFDKNQGMAFSRP